MPTLTVVLDTNLFVSAFLTPGGEAWEILRRAQQQRLVLSTTLLAEIEEVLLTILSPQEALKILPPVKEAVSP